ncbi:uncharacterized protein LOC144138288 [Haemaphysalis longicornis]
MALGTHKGVAIEGIQGELGWSSFEAREAIAKLSYEVRAFRLPEDNVVRWLLDYMVYRERHTRWSRRTRKLRSTYGLPAPCLEGGQPAISPSALRKLANQREEAKWREGASKKVTLKIYCREKGTIRKATCYDNSRGSDLLAEARLGSLRTRVWRKRTGGTLPTECVACGVAEESEEHILLHCTAIKPAPSAATLEEALGFRAAGPHRPPTGSAADDGATSPSMSLTSGETSREERTNAAAGAPHTPGGNAVQASKRRLEDWWRMSLACWSQ